MTIEESKAFITRKYPWHIEEDTFQLLDAEYCLWVAKVTTSQKTPELTFPILVCCDEVFSELDNSNLRALGEWCLKQEIAA